jgi:hypothetical protein
MMGAVPAESNDETASDYSNNNEATNKFRDALEEALSATQRSAPRSGHSQKWTIEPENAETLESILTEWKDDFSHNPSFLAHALYTSVDKTQPSTALDIINKPLVSEVEKICQSLGFSIFLATFSRHIEAQEKRDDQDLRS